MQARPIWACRRYSPWEGHFVPFPAGRILAFLSGTLVLLLLVSASPGLGVSHAVAQEATGGFSPSFTVGGNVATPKQFNLAGLQALPAATENVQFKSGTGMEQHSYTGARLYDLLIGLGPQFEPSRKNDKLDWYVQVVGSDGYVAIVSWGEIDPGWEAKDVLVAYQDNGQPLSPGDGMAKLVVPGDIQGGRYVSNITAIYVMPATP
jgi:hypothetical protein